MAGVSFLRRMGRHTHQQQRPQTTHPNMSFYTRSIMSVLRAQRGWGIPARGVVPRAARALYSTDAKSPGKESAAAAAAETEAPAEEDEYYVDVSNLESRWPALGFEAQQDIISYLNVKQEFDWKYLLPEEKRAIYYIAYGRWGPRDAKVMSASEFVFKLMTNMLLFSVLGFSMLNYAIDQEKIAELDAADAADAAASSAADAAPSGQQ